MKSVTGIVLVGGRSTRFGSDKALYPINGTPMGRLVADNMRASGIEHILCVGGSQEIAVRLGLQFLADSFPGEGPLGGLVTAMRDVSSDVMTVVPCDVPRLGPERIRQLVEAVSEQATSDVSVLTTSQDHWLCSAWRIKNCRDVVEQQFESGERAIHRVANLLTVQRVSATEAEMTNVNTLDEARDLERMIALGD
ncbi:MAG: molybdenum cofactor guanylyltransferase [Ilumatobacteraceae bacterium]